MGWGRIYGWAETLVTWMQRSSIGQAILTAIIADLVGVLAMAKDQPLWLVLTVGFVVAAAISYLLDVWLPKLANALEVPLEVIVRLVTGPQLLNPSSSMSSGHVEFSVFIQNTSGAKRASLRFISFHVWPKQGAGGMGIMLDPQHVTCLNPNLGPHEQTTCTVSVDIPDVAEIVRTHHFGMTLLLMEHVSRRRVTLDVPGMYPLRKLKQTFNN